MSKRHTDIDPFNAGEPILPWCDPETYTDDPHVDLDDTDEHVVAERPSASSANDSPSSRSSSKRPKAPSRKERDRSVARRSKRKAKAAADQPIKARKSARPILIVILLLFLLSGGFSLVASIPGCVTGALSSIFAPYDDTSSLEDFPEAPAYSPDDLSEAEGACLDATTLRMDQLTTPGSAEYQQAAKLIADDFSQTCEDCLYYSAEELGLDGAAVADWIIGSLRYEMSSVHAFPNDPSPYGSAYLDVTTADPLSLYSSFFTPASSYLTENGLLGYDDEPGPDSTAQQHLRDLLQTALGSSTDETEHFVRFELIYVDGTWSISETDYTTELDYIFGL